MAKKVINFPSKSKSKVHKLKTATGGMSQLIHQTTPLEQAEWIINELIEARAHRERIYAELLTKIRMLNDRLDRFVAR